MSAYSIMLIVGTIAMCVITILRRAHYNLSIVKSTMFSLILTVVGVIGCKLLYIIENYELVKEQGLTFGGFSFYGAVFLIPISFLALGRLFSLKPLQAVDLCAPGVAIMISFMRIGCFIDGCCGANPIEFCGRTIHLPVQLMESAYDFVLLIVLWSLERASKASGKLYPVFMVAYGVMRFGIEFLRDTPKDWLYMSHGQWYSLVAILVGVVWILLYRNKKELSDGI